MRTLAIDFGRRRIGLAISDPTGQIALPLEVLDRKQHKDWFEKLVVRVRELGVSQLVVGLPKNMDGTLGPAAQVCQDFAGKLRDATQLPLEFVDERLTSTAAHASLRETGKGARHAKEHVDAVAATLILQVFMRKTSNRGGE